MLINMCVICSIIFVLFLFFQTSGEAKDPHSANQPARALEVVFYALVVVFLMFFGANRLFYFLEGKIPG